MSLNPRSAMAQRTTGFAKTRAVTKTNRSSDSKRGVAEAPAAPRAIAVKLGPLLAPYKKHGRLSLRIERLPQLARLSAGRNNGDSSWSLTLDELEDLTYLPPPGMVEAHSLALRIIGLDGGGSTLAVLDFPVSSGAAGSGTGHEGFAAQDKAAELSDITQLGLLRDELTEVKATLAERESDLAKARQKAEQAETERQKIGAQLAQGRAASRAELDEGKFASLSAGLLVRKGEAGPSKVAPEGDEIELRHLREELAVMRASLAKRDTVLAEARLATEQARERRQEEWEAALSKAKIAWNAEAAARLAAAQAQWEEKSTKALAEARIRSETARDSGIEFELNLLREQCTALQARLSNRESALAEARLALEQAREHRQQESEAALSNAERIWNADEAARLTAAQAQWEEKSTRALAEARAQVESARDCRDAIELRRLREELAVMQASLGNRENAVAEARLALERAREYRQQESEAALSKAERIWKADEAARLAAAQAQWEEKSTKALAEARAQVESARDSENAIELRRLREELAAMQTSLGNRETAVAEARLALEQAREHRQQEYETALSNAEKAWKSDEAARLAAAQAQWEEKSATMLAEATQRLEATEAALKQARIKAEAARDSGNAVELRRLREELAATQANLSNRESALAEARLALEQSRELPTPEAKIVLKPDRIGNAAGKLERQNHTRARGHLIRDLIVAASLAASAVVVYPRIDSFLPQIGTIFGDPRAPADAAASPKIAEQHMAVVNHGANVRAGPSATADVISMLQRGVNVVIVEQRGSWTLVRMDGESGKTEPQQGWVYSSFLTAGGGSG